MTIVTKEDVTRLLKKKNAQETKEAKLAVKSTKIGYIVLIFSLLWWILLFIYQFESYFIILTFIGSSMAGTAYFLIVTGTIQYFKHHERLIKVHWIYNTVLRTLFSIYIWASYIIIFIFVRTLFQELDLIFLATLTVVALPTMIAYSFSRSLKIQGRWEQILVFILE